MANVIKHKRGSGSDPSASNLVVGELAIRTDTGKLFTKMDSGSIAEIAGGGSDIAINTLSSSSATGGGSATFNGSAYRFTLSSPPSVSAAQLLVSINGVIQKPVAGTGQPSEGFSVDGTDIILGDAPETGADFFILTFKSLGVSEPADNSVTSAKIVDGAIVNADINASAAIAGSKISPSFTSDLTITDGSPAINFTDSDNDSDFRIIVNDGKIKIQDTTNSNAVRFSINSSGNVGIGTSSPSSLLHIADATEPAIRLQDTNAVNSDFKIYSPNGDNSLRIYHENTSSDLFHIASGGNVGIGTTSPESFGGGHKTFEVAGSTTSQGGVFKTATSDSAGTGTTGTEMLMFTDNSKGAINVVSADPLTLSTANTERMRIDSSGRLLLGTSSARAVGGESNPRLQIEGSGNTSNSWVNLTRFQAGTGAANFQFAKARSNTPGTYTVVQNGDNLGQISFLGADGTDMANYAAIMKVQVDGTPGSNDMPGRFVFMTTADGGTFPTERMRIDSAGNVGINVSNPTIRLHVNGGSNGGGVAEILRLDTSGNTNGDGSKIAFSRAGTIRTEISSIKNETSNNETDIAFSTTNLGSLGEKMRIDSDGNVGIGTSSPSGGKLHIAHGNELGLYTSGPYNFQAKFESTDAEAAIVIEDNGSTNDGNRIGVISDVMAFTTANSERMRIDSSGTLCIGTTSVHNTGKKLSISSTDHAMEIQLTSSSNVRCITLRHGRASGGTGGEQITFENSDGSSVGTIESTGSATTFNTSSDYRLKENITAISDGITRLKTLKPSRFNFKVDKDTTFDGFLAHEVTAVPEAIKGTKDEVATTDDDAIGLKKGDPIYQRIDHSKLVPLLTAALQEAVGKIETLETKVAALEAK